MSVLVGRRVYFYRPPNLHVDKTKRICLSIVAAARLKSVDKKRSDIIIMCDFNLPDINWTVEGPVTVPGPGSQEHELIDTLNDHYIHQIIELLVITDDTDRINFIVKGPPLGHTVTGRGHFTIKFDFILQENLETEFV